MTEKIEAASREAWSKPQSVKIDVPLDCFCVGRIVCYDRNSWSRDCDSADEDEPGIQIRLDSEGQVFLSIQAHEHVSYLKTKTVPFVEFVEAMGKTFFGEKWAERTAPS